MTGRKAGGEQYAIHRGTNTRLVDRYFRPALPRCAPQRQPQFLNDITVRVGDAIEVADLLAQHEDEHGPLWKYSAAVAQGGADDEVKPFLHTGFPTEYTVFSHGLPFFHTGSRFSRGFRVSRRVSRDVPFAYSLPA